MGAREDLADGKPAHDPCRTETARALLRRHGLPEDVVDGALCLHAQELARQIREETARLKACGVLEPHKFRPCRDAADQIDPTKDDAAPFAEQARERAFTLLSDDERAMLRYALELTEDRIASEGDEFTDADGASVESLRRLANGPVVAYRNSHRPGVLLCREHGDGWAGLTPLHAHDLPDGGACTYGDPADPTDVCGRDVLTPQGVASDG